jgi:hypothetical protein
MPPFQLLPTELFGLSAPAGNDKAVAMQAVVMAVVTSLASVVRSRMALQIEVLALRHRFPVRDASELPENQSKGLSTSLSLPPHLVDRAGGVNSAD